jgi:DNA-binding transcriptional ArsR family regulator
VRAVDVFALLAEPVRFRIIEILATGEHTSGQLADVLHHEFGVSRSAVSRHLGVLAAHGFAIRRAQERYRFYRLSPDALAGLDRAVDRLHELWDARYGWPYVADPLDAAHRTVKAHPHRGRGARGRSSIPVITEVTEDNDPWQWIGD